MLYRSQFGLSVRPDEYSQHNRDEDKEITQSSLLTQEKFQKLCCFISCKEFASVTCYDCMDIYCTICWNNVHSSARLLSLHKKVPLESNVEMSVILAMCPKHNMEKEFDCKTCGITVCCFCFIDDHENHEKQMLSKLTADELTEFNVCKENVTMKLKNLLICRKDLASLKSKEISVIQTEITDYFNQLNVKLQALEKRLKKSAIDELHKNVGKLFSDVDKAIETHEKVLDSSEAMNIEKLNAKKIFNLMKDLNNIPCPLLSTTEHRKNMVNLIVDPIIEDIESFFKIIGSESYNLVAEPDLPLDNMDAKNLDSDRPSPMLEKELNEKTFTKTQIALNEKTVRVEITHIDSLECFYVQRTQNQKSLFKLNHKIEIIAASSNPLNETTIEVNGLYLVLYEQNDKRFWTRGRIIEVINNKVEHRFKVFYIDYGKTEIIDISKIRAISPVVSQKKPYALQCRLHNIMPEDWSSNAHIVMGQITTGKILYMLVRKINGGIYDVELFISSSDGRFTSIIDILRCEVSECLNESQISVPSVENLPIDDFGSFTKYTILSSSTKFKLSQHMNILIANVIDPYTIYVHLETDYIDLITLSLKMEEFFEAQSDRIHFVPIEGIYIIVKYNDSVRGIVHRAFVEKIDREKQQVNVYCIDWGMRITVPFSSTFMLIEEFAKFECPAILIKLYGVQPYNRLNWDKNASEYLQKYFQSRQILKMLVHDNNPLEVSLFEKHKNLLVCINSLLVRENLANSTVPASKMLEWPHSSFNKLFASNRTLLSDQISSVEKLSDSSEDEVPILKRIEIVHFKRPDLIYIKFTRNEPIESELYQNLQLYSNIESGDNTTWAENDLCVVLYNNCYYRGKIMKMQDGIYQVYLYDFNKYLELSKDKIFECNNIFNKFPNLVIKAHLGGIHPAGGNQWSLGSIEVLEKIFTNAKNIYGTELCEDTSVPSVPMKIWYTKTKMYGQSEPFMVKLFCLNNILLKLGYANQKPSGYWIEQANKDRQSPINDVPLSDNTDELENLTDNLKLVSPLDRNESLCSPGVEFVNIENSSNYTTKETDITDWKPAIPITKQHFFAYVLGVETEGILYIREKDLQKDYKEMEYFIKQYFENKPTAAEYHEWKPGQLCTIALNGSYYRGKIEKVNSPNKIVAVMVDFGGHRIVSYKSLHKEVLYPEIGIFATKIKLNAVFAKHGKWLASDFQTFSRIMPEYVYVNIQGPLDAEIPAAEIFNEQNLNINDSLIEMCPHLARCESIEILTSDKNDPAIEEQVDDIEM